MKSRKSPTRISDKFYEVSLLEQMENFMGRGSHAPHLYLLDSVNEIRASWREDNKAYFLHRERPAPSWTPPDYKLSEEPFHAVFKPVMRPPIMCTRLERDGAEDYQMGVDIALAMVPDYLKTLFAEWGLQLRLGRSINDISPRYKNIPARGQNISVIHTSGLYETRIATVTQGFIDLETEEYVECGYLETLRGVLHELGHGLEEIIFNVDIDPENPAWSGPHQRDFFKAHKDDVKLIDADTRKRKLDYYLLKEDGGSHISEADACSETLADMFVEKMVGTETKLQDLFTRTSDVLDKILSSLEFLISREPDYGHVRIYRPSPDLMASFGR